MLRKRPLLSATMFGGAAMLYPADTEILRPDHRTAPSGLEVIPTASSEENRIDALTKLKSLFDSGVLTEEQYESEWARLTGGI